MRILLTGASGFVGRAVLERLRSSGTHEIRCAVRSSSVAGVEHVVVGNLEPAADWSLGNPPTKQLRSEVEFSRNVTRGDSSEKIEVQ